MATLAESDNMEICKTQDGFMPTFGNSPETNTEPVDSDLERIMVGNFTLIPRWDTRTTTPCVLEYYLQTNTFEDSANAELTRTLLQQAASLWNSVKCGVTFAAASDPQKAHFDVIYDKRGNDGATAMAFFPNAVDKVYIYPPAFNDPATKKQLVNSITHELGHVLGLRHEHALEEGGAFLIGEMNQNSIMGYNRSTRSLQQSDREGLKTFYKFDKGIKIEEVPIVDFKPVFLKRQ